jgi:hypothetical protein
MPFADTNQIRKRCVLALVGSHEPLCPAGSSFLFILFLSQDLTVSQLALNSGSSYLSLLSGGLTDVYYHA